MRFVHSRVITNCEEIAFYRGHEIEHGILYNAFKSLEDHLSYVYGARIFYNMMEGFFMKYVWSATGVGMIAIPVFFYEVKKKLRKQTN